MKIALVGKIKKDIKQLKRQIEFCGYEIVSRNPDVVISFGGDGSFLIAERRFPSVPKLPVRDKSICKRCNIGKLDRLLMRLNRMIRVV